MTTNRAISWQQPYVNTFKHFAIISDKNVLKQGDVTSVMDSSIKSSVFKIAGASPTSNFINMPKLSGQSLSLNGRYMYILFKPVPSKCFSIHVDLTTSEKIILRVSFSNLFREFKSTSTWLQFPYVIRAPTDSVFEKTESHAKDLSGSAPPVTKWTILCLDLVQLAQLYANRTYQSVRSYKLCANMLVKNVITSDILYEPGVTHAEARLRGGSAFPRELSYPCEKYENWHALYDYVSFPSESFCKPFDSVGQSRIFVGSLDTAAADEEPKRVQPRQTHTQTGGAVSNSAIDAHTNLLRQRSLLSRASKNIELPMIGVGSGEINFVDPEAHKRQNQSDIHVYPKMKAGLNDERVPSAHHLDQQKHMNEESESEEDGDGVQVPSAAMTKSGVAKPARRPRTSLEPDPIMQLKKIVGYGSRQQHPLSGGQHCLAGCCFDCVRWTLDSQYIIYNCQAIVVAYHLVTGVQQCFVGHSDRVSCLALNPSNSLLASGQTGPYSLVRLWDFRTRKCVSIFCSHDHSLYLLEFSSCGKLLCGVGKDKQGKTTIVIWDVKDVKSGAKASASVASQPRVLAQAHTDVHIHKILFVHYDNSRLISCGRDNVRFWRLKDETLRSCAVNLASYIPAQQSLPGKSSAGQANSGVFLEFTDVCINSKPRAPSAASTNDDRAYACTRSGQIFEFSLARMEIESVRVLEPSAAANSTLLEESTPRGGGGVVSGADEQSLRLNSLTVSDAFFVTGSDDGFARIWSADFSQVCVEAEHETAVSLVRFSPDQSKILTATCNGNLGILDVKKKEYVTLIRSHTQAILDVSFDRGLRYLATTSSDGTIRVWNFRNFRQIYDFSAPAEKPTRLSFLNRALAATQQDDVVIACGFSSGKIRIFNVNHAKLLIELHSPHVSSNKKPSQLELARTEITDLAYSNDGRRLISGDLLKYVCLYDVDSNYTLLRMLPNILASCGSMALSCDEKYLAIVGSSDTLVTVFDSLSLNEILRIDIANLGLSGAGAGGHDLSQFSVLPLSFNGAAPAIGADEGIVRLAFAPADVYQLLCVTSANRLLKLDTRNGRLVGTVPRLHRHSTDCVCVSHDARYMVTSGDNALIKIWDYEMRLEKNFQKFIGHSTRINKMLFTPDNKQLITAGDTLIVWDVLSEMEEMDEAAEGACVAAQLSKDLKALSQGRDFDKMKEMPIRVIREIKDNCELAAWPRVNPAVLVNDYNQVNVLSQLAFNNNEPPAHHHRLELLRMSSVASNSSFEKPRTPPIAEKMTLHMDDDANGGAIEDTFDELNSPRDDSEHNLSFAAKQSLGSKSSSGGAGVGLSQHHPFADLPVNFVSLSLDNCHDGGRIERVESAYVSSSLDDFELPSENVDPRRAPLFNDSLAFKPSALKHLITHRKASTIAKKHYSAPANKSALRLGSVIGYNGKYAAVNMVWDAQHGFFAFTLGALVCVEDLKTGQQTLLHAHQEDVSCLALNTECLFLASASACNAVATSASRVKNQLASKAQITVWDCRTLRKQAVLFHPNAFNITCLSYSSDDRFLVSVSDYRSVSMVVWSGLDYSCLATVDYTKSVVHDLAWNVNKPNELVTCGENTSLTFWCLDESVPEKRSAMRLFECEIPLAIGHEHDRQDYAFTALAFSSDGLLFAATDFGVVTVWNARTRTCFLNWKADCSEIDILISIQQRLITGSSKGNLKLWNVAKIHEVKSNGPKSAAASLRTNGLTIENEICLNSPIKCCKFDALLDIGMVTTAKGSLWYVNWPKEMSTRLVSTHTAKINSILCINNQFLSTVGDDGSLNIWSLSDRERLVQFEAKVAAKCQALIDYDPNLHQHLILKSSNRQIASQLLKQTSSSYPFVAVGYGDGSLRLFDIDKKNTINKIKPLAHELTCLNYCQKTSFLLAGSLEGLVAIIDLAKCATVRIVQDHRDVPIVSLDSVYDHENKSTIWLAASRDRCLSVWNAKWHDEAIKRVDFLDFSDDKPAKEAKKKTDAARLGHKYWSKFPPTLAQFVRGSNETSASHRVGSHSSSSIDEAYATSDTIVFTGFGSTKELVVYNFRTKQTVRKMELSEWAECLCLAPRTNLIAFGTRTRLLQIKDFKQGLFQDYAQHSDTVSSVKFSSDGRHLFSTAFNEIFIWDVCLS